MWYKDGQEFKEINGYEVRGQWFPRVTKILDIKSKPGLESFFREVGHYDSVENIKNKSAEEGTMVHEAVQKLLTGESPVVPVGIEPAIRGFQEFNEGRGVAFHHEFVEKRVWSGRHRYAGTIDALASVDGKFGVLDIKTSSGFYPEFNLQTAAYVSALQEYDVKKALSLPREIETRWILKIDQYCSCGKCGSILREKGGRKKVKNGKGENCNENAHEWGAIKGHTELREFPYFYKDIKAFMAAKILWEWENGYWLKKIGYLV